MKLQFRSWLFSMLVIFLWMSPPGAFAQVDRKEPEKKKIKITDGGESVQVSIDNKLFTAYNYSTYKKPVFYPVMGPGQIPMTRNFPMKKVDGESKDHPHHKSMWIGHQINGVDFWSEKGGSVKLESLNIDSESSSFVATHNWINDATKKIIVSDEVTVFFGQGKVSRFIDYQIKFIASRGQATFADSKEGLFAVRVHPQLRHARDVNQGVIGTAGKMNNSEGQSGKEIWGQRAKWVDYSGTINNKLCGIAIFDHPKNLRHPTTWHARDYGLLAANPFGLSFFQKERKKSGAFFLPEGSSLTLRYRVLLHAGKFDPAKIDSEYRKFMATEARLDKKSH